MKWSILLLQDEERGRYAGSATTPLVTNSGYPNVEYDKPKMPPKGRNQWQNYIRLYESDLYCKKICCLEAGPRNLASMNSLKSRGFLMLTSTTLPQRQVID